MQACPEDGKEGIDLKPGKKTNYRSIIIIAMLYDGTLMPKNLF
jgi:hypothetical protein